MLSKTVESIISWNGNKLQSENLPKTKAEKAFFYNSCSIGPLKICVGDFVLINNVGLAVDYSISQCRIAKILYIYEAVENYPDEKKDKYRAIVEWYSKCEEIPKKIFNGNEKSFNFECDLIQDFRSLFDTDISINTIFNKCSVLFGNITDSPEDIINMKKENKENLIYVCRYKLVRTTEMGYTLVPLSYNTDKSLRNSIKKNDIEQTPTRKIKELETINETDSLSEQLISNESKTNQKSLYCVVKLTDVIKSNSKITPIKIIKNIDNSSNFKDHPDEKIKQQNYYEPNGNYLTDSPYTKDTSSPILNASLKARRKLSLDHDHPEILNYSIVNGTPDDERINIKLKLSNKQQNNACIKNIVDDVVNEVTTTTPLRRSTRKRSQDQIFYSCLTPSKKNTDLDYGTPATRRRSILKTPGSVGRVEYGTPKKNIKLSNIVEECLPYHDHVLRTPSTRNRRSRKLEESEDEFTPKKKSVKKNKDENLKTPKSNRKIINLETSDESDEELSPEKKSVKKNKDENLKTPKSNRKIINLETSDESDEELSPEKKSVKKNKDENLKTPKSNRKIIKAETPGSRRKLINTGVITPNIPKKEIKTIKRKSEIQLARERLHVASTPKSLPCRETEFNNIYSFLERKICDKSGGCMYVSGVPGTGKTATVTEVIRCLKEESNSNEIPEFNYIEINGMRLTEPQQAYVQIYYQLSGKIVASKQAYNLLQKLYTTSSSKKITTILLIDELDIICNRRQDVVYNLLDWSTKQVARLAVITIANTMDLPERMLLGKVTSRLGLTRLTFLPYTFKQLQEIVTDRLGGSESFKSEAVQLVARKIAAVSGDARRALDICRRATEIAEYSLEKTNDSTVITKKRTTTEGAIVNLVHVQQALGEMISSGKIQAIKNCSKLEKLFLQAVSAEVIRTGVEETIFNGVYLQLETLAAFSDMCNLPSVGIVMKICSKLSEMRLLICEHSRADIYRKILLNVSTDDIQFALQANLE